MTRKNSDSLVLITGGSGFVAIHCIVQLLEQGYKVRTTLRSLDKKEQVIRMLSEAGITASNNLEFIKADLTQDDNWDSAVGSSGSRPCSIRWRRALSLC